MAKKLKAKDKADLKDKPINSEETLEEDESLEEETDAYKKILLQIRMQMKKLRILKRHCLDQERN